MASYDYDNLQAELVIRLEAEARESMVYPGIEAVEYHVNSRIREIADKLIEMLNDE